MHSFCVPGQNTSMPRYHGLCTALCSNCAINNHALYEAVARQRTAGAKSPALHQS